MSFPSLLLRLLLMISLVLNGLNVAMAVPLGEPDTPAVSAHAGHAGSTAPPCHDAAPMVAAHHDGTLHLLPDNGGDHCQIKQCLRSCAQQPALVVVAALLPAAAYYTEAPQALLHAGRPTPALPPISRPPIA